jgi:hypothetical protein
METILALFIALIVWIFSQWKIIIAIGFGIYILKSIESKILLYEEKLFDIDDNVKQIAEKVGVYEDVFSETQSQKFVRERKNRPLLTREELDEVMTPEEKRVRKGLYGSEYPISKAD